VPDLFFPTSDVPHKLRDANKYQPAEGWHFKTPKEWQDYSIDINTEENPVRGVRAII